ncbi:MAG: hypothetical protein LUC27_08700 [Lachnospiraceae bacterium]|nr:hypothetical protein [Lachnospiraceae bacterium]
MSDEQKLACDQFIEYCKRYTLAATPADDEALQQTCEEYGCTVTDASDEILALMADASEPVIEEMKASGDVDTDLIDTYVANAEAASAD